MNLYFTYKSRDTLKSVTLFITVKAITKLNLGHRNKFEIEFPKKLAVMVHVLQTMQNWSFHVAVLQRTAKRCAKSYNACAQLLFCSLNLSDVAIGYVIIQDKCRNYVNHNVLVKSKLEHPLPPTLVFEFLGIFCLNPPYPDRKAVQMPPPLGK